MKLAVVALILGLCLAVNCAVIDSNDVSYDNDNTDLLEFTSLGSAEGTMDDEYFSIFGILYFTLMGTLRTLKGVNCSIRHVIETRNAGTEFLNDVKGCNSGALKGVNKLLNQVQAVIGTSNDIIHLNSNVCNNGALSDAADGNKSTPIKCFFKLLFKMWTLEGQVSKTVKLAKNLSSTPGEFTDCSKTAISDLVSVFIQFPSFIKQCSKVKN
ncbi:uncharacterized protein [Eurosta solidaginis]|uniref:uncharacterized protein n=1 Tax=Eurosta solidaginis TaxID=178769 RepID=UPI0035316F5F